MLCPCRQPAFAHFLAAAMWAMVMAPRIGLESLVVLVAYGANLNFHVLTCDPCEESVRWSVLSQPRRAFISYLCALGNMPWLAYHALLSV